MTAPVEGIDAAQVDAWFAQHVPGVTGPLDYHLVAGGNSNLTYIVTASDGARFVLRRPPLGHVLATAHDMGREHRILTALAGSEVPVPATFGLCGDLTVNGAPFYVMEMVDGAVLRSPAVVVATFDEGQRRQAGLHLVETLAAIHRTVPADVGLGDLGRMEGYVARQLKRWKRQLDQSRTRPLAILDELHGILSARLPEDRHLGIVHGDYRLDNCIIGPDTRVRAVLDWELCTLGDTLADVGMLMVYWGLPGDVDVALKDAPTLAPGFPSREEMLARYAEVRGIELEGIDYYVAFAYWRLACITEGVYARYLNGDMGDRVEEAKPFEQSVLDLAEASSRIVSTWA